MAPSGGFFPVGTSGGSGVSWFSSRRTRIAVLGRNRCTPPDATLGFNCRSGVISSRIQNERPYVAATKSSCSIARIVRSEEHTSELQSRGHLVCRLLLEKKKKLVRHRRK